MTTWPILSVVTFLPAFGALLVYLFWRSWGAGDVIWLIIGLGIMVLPIIIDYKRNTRPKDVLFR